MSEMDDVEVLGIEDPPVAIRRNELRRANRWKQEERGEKDEALK
jgi:hypothetical protein